MTISQTVPAVLYRSTKLTNQDGSHIMSQRSNFFPATFSICVRNFNNTCDIKQTEIEVSSYCLEFVKIVNVKPKKIKRHFHGLKQWPEGSVYAFRFWRHNENNEFKFALKKKGSKEKK